MSEKLPKEEVGDVPVEAEEAISADTEDQHDIEAKEAIDALNNAENISDKGEVRERDRQEALSEIRASISNKEGEDFRGAQSVGAQSKLSTVEVPKKQTDVAGSGGGGSFGGGLLKSFKFIKKIFQFGFLILVATVASAMEKVSKMKFGKDKTKGDKKKHSEKSDHGGHDHAHAAPKSGGGGHAPEKKSHGHAPHGH